MGDKSGIEWTSATWNPVTGCSKVSPGCAHCYAERLFPRTYPGRDFGDVRVHHDRLDQPLRWRKPRRIFVNSMSDLFHESVPTEFLDSVFLTMARAKQHTFQVLTKRPDRMLAYLSELTPVDRRGNRYSKAFFRVLMSNFMMPELIGVTWPLSNVWLGVSVENQRMAVERIPLLLQTPAAVRFLSCEPLLGEPELRRFLKSASVVREGGSTGAVTVRRKESGIDWVIVGGESGPKARPMDLAWARGIIHQCRAAGVPVFVKQLGSAPESIHDGISYRGSRTERPSGFYRFLRGKGGDPSEWPEDLQVREFPVTETAGEGK